MPISRGYREDSASQCVESTLHSACRGSHALDVAALVAVVKMNVAPRTPQEAARDFLGSPNGEDHSTPCPHPIPAPGYLHSSRAREAMSPPPPRKCATGARWQAISDICHLLTSRHLREALSLQTGRAKLTKDVTLEEVQAGPCRSDFVTSSWGVL